MNHNRPTMRTVTSGFIVIRPPSPSKKARMTKKCNVLRRNDPETTTFDDADATFCYSQQLGEALVGNTHVSTMRLQAWKVFGLDEVPTAQQKTLDPLLDYLGSGPALRCLYINDGRRHASCPVVTDLLLSAVQENSNVQELSLILTKIPAPLFQTLLPKTKSLTTLSIASPVDAAGTAAELDWVREGITSNTSLEIIQMDCSSEWSAAILTGLVNKGGNAQHLNKLVVKTPSHVTAALWDAVTAYLRLERPSSPLQELALVAQQKSSNGVAWTAADLVPLLCLPTLTNDDNDDVVTPTVGSQIQSLSVYRLHSCFDGLFQGLADHAARIRIQKLKVVPSKWKDVQEHAVALALCIVKVSSLRHLDFDDDFLDGNGDLPDAIVASLKENGHVHSISANVKSKIAHAYCDRNRLLGQLLMEASAAATKEKSQSPAATAAAAAHRPGLRSAKRTHSEMDGASDQAAADESGSNKKLKSSPSLLPTLFKSAIQVPSLQSSMLTRTLLRLPESIASKTSSDKEGALEMAPM